jgi:hypothetical protein
MFLHCPRASMGLQLRLIPGTPSDSDWRIHSIGVWRAVRISIVLLTRCLGRVLTDIGRRVCCNGFRRGRRLRAALASSSSTAYRAGRCPSQTQSRDKLRDFNRPSGADYDDAHHLGMPRTSLSIDKHSYGPRANLPRSPNSSSHNYRKNQPGGVRRIKREALHGSARLRRH